MGEKPNGNLTRVKNFFKNFKKQIANDEKNLRVTENRIEEIVRHKGFADYRDYTLKIQELRKEIEEIDRKIGLTYDENYTKMHHAEDELLANKDKIRKIYGGRKRKKNR